MRIAVVFGGTSSEREVSVASAVEVIRALREQGHEAIAVDSARGRLSLEEEGRLALSFFGFDSHPESAGCQAA